MSLKHGKVIKSKIEKKENEESKIKYVTEEKKEKVISKKINTLLSSTDKYPLAKWSKYVKCGYVKRVSDLEIDGKVIELSGPSNCVWLVMPKDLGESLGINYNWLFFVMKTCPDKQVIIDIQVLDNSNVRRTFKFDTKTNITKLRHTLAQMDLSIKPGQWSSLEMDLHSLVTKNYGTHFLELCRIQIHGSCKIRRVFSASSYVGQDEMPLESRIGISNTIAEMADSLDVI